MNLKKLAISEIERVFTKGNIIAYLIVIVISISFVSDGVSEYKTFVKELKALQNYEEKAVEQYASMEIYGAYGLRIAFSPSKLAVFIKSRVIQQMVYTCIGMKTNSSTNKSFEGRAMFPDESQFNGFIGFTMTFWSAVLIYFGVSTFRGSKQLKLINSKLKIAFSTFVRLLTLNVSVVAIYLIAFVYAQFKGMEFSQTEILDYAKMIIVSLFLLSLFFFIGLMWSHKNTKRVYPYFVWIVLIVILPSFANKIKDELLEQIPSVEDISLIKLTNAQEFERQAIEQFKSLPKEKNVDKKKIARKLMNDYRQKGNAKNNEQNSRVLNATINAALSLEKYLLISPISWYSFFTHEIVGDGVYSIIYFQKYKSTKGAEFFNFYCENRYGRSPGEKALFIKSKDDYVFISDRSVPHTIWVELCSIITCIFICVLLFERRLQNITKKGKTELNVAFNLPKEQSAYFSYCEDVEKKEVLFNSLNQKSTILIDNFKKEDFDGNMKTRNLLLYNAQPSGVYSFLNKVNFDMSLLELRIKEVQEESFLKVIFAILMANENKYIVLNDFTAKRSPIFDRTIRTVLIDQIRRGKTVVYLSSNMFDTQLSEEIFKTPQEGLMPIELSKISLR